VIFVDTGAFVARYVKSDQHHRRARSEWKRLERQAPRLFTSNFVLDETFTLLARRTTYAFAAGKARSLLSSTVLTILRPARDDEMSALQLFEKYADQAVSFTDCVSFALMRRHALQRAFAFDRHFRDVGYTVVPGGR
jgi:predicted nucleic acid-binding protein